MFQSDSNNAYFQGTYGPADKTKPCVTCEAGKYQDVAQQSSCIQCPAGKIPNDAKTECVKCAAVSFFTFCISLV